ncbi:sulfate permease [Nigerium sp.]|uniref:SulP family inorganic anion transporter n=1 Tax=Nigerium sp. TaxID=2042655 RepID=UPI0032220C9F
MENRPMPRWGRIAPGAYTLAHYERGWLRGDVLAGVTVCAYLIPQVMAYAEIAGLPAVTGLWAMCAPLAVYAVVGPSRQLSVGPESTTALMTAAGLAALLGASEHDRWAATASLLAVAVGVVCLLGWLGRLGFLANLLSRPVLVGYLTGIAVLMICSQLGKVTRLRIAGENPVEQALSLAEQAAGIHVPTLALAAAVFVLLVAVRAWRPHWPGPLLVMLLAAGVVALVGPDRWGLRVVGEVPAGLPAPAVPDASGISLLALAPYALGIAMVGYTDNVLTSRAFSAKRREPTDAGQELFALGLVNVATGFLHGFPCSSSGSRTVLGDAAGSRTQAHSLVALAGVIAVLMMAGPVLGSFPTAALGAVIVYAATRLVDVGELRRIARFRKSELVLTLVTAVAVVWFGVLTGIGLAIVLSLLDLIRRIAHPHDGVLGYVPGLAGMHDVADYANARQVPGLLVYRYDSPLFFANSADFMTRALRAVDVASTPVEWFCLNAEANVEVDLTAVDTLVELRARLEARGITFVMARVKQDLRDDLARAGFLAVVGEDRVFATLPTAVAAFESAYAERHGRPPWPADAG